MSAIKRSRTSRARPGEAGEQSHASKKIKSSHVPATNKKEGLGFLVDEDARKGRKVDGKLTNGVSDKRTTRVDESKAVVAPDGNSNQVIDISSAEDESSEYESEAENNGQQAIAGGEDVDMADGEPEDAADQEEPSFGDMLSARHPEPIDVQSAFPQDEQHAVVPSTGKQVLAAPTGTSLSTVLTQALRTNDKDMLETCFQMADQQSIRMTIQRLQSHLVGPLMQRLAERIHRRPGRTGHLMAWIQWSLVAHGGYLVTQPEIMGKLRALNQVLRERAQGLQPLLQLKGKLDMLGAQLELRRSTLATSARAHDDEDDEAGVLYIEGQDDDDEGSEAELAALERPSKRSSKSQAQGEEYHTASESDESDDEAGAANGFAAHEGSMSAEEEDEEDAQNGMLDLEAEESDDGEEGSEDDDASEVSEVDDVEDEDGEESEEEVEVKQPKPQTLNRKR
jgi:U3 small nucleolar RNA-associated protein 5